jgi:hypothetical protein
MVAEDARRSRAREVERRMLHHEEHPEVESKIASGELNVSTVSSLRGFVRREEKSAEETRELLQQIENKSKDECERLFATLAPESARPERERQTS